MWIWLAVGGVLLLTEALTANLLFASLGISALAAALAAGIGADVVTQGIIFGVASAISLVMLRPIALRHMKKRSPKAATNTEALIGTSALTLTEVTERGGQVKLAGEVWSARTESGVLAKDSDVKVVAIRGATAIVREG